MEKLSHSKVVLAGHMLQLLAGGDSQWVKRVMGSSSNMGERLHKAVFRATDQRDRINTSCLAHQKAASSCSSLPTAAELSSTSLFIITNMLIKLYGIECVQ